MFVQTTPGAKRLMAKDVWRLLSPNPLGLFGNGEILPT